MARLRYVKNPEQIKLAAESNPEFLESTVTSVRCVYETDPNLARAVVPRPLVPADDPQMCVTFSQVAIHISPEFTLEIGSTIFGVRALHDGSEGLYLITMPMTTEQAVVPGRETYGEPKKIAAIDFTVEGDQVSSSVSRMGFTYLSVRGTLGETLPAREFSEYAWCFKALPSVEGGEGGTGFDGEPLLVRLEWKHHHREVRKVDGELTLGESPFDPVADLPVRRLVSMQYEVGRTESIGRVLRSVPGEWLLPFLHQRYDDPTHPGIEV